MKKLIKRVDARHKARLNLELQLVRSNASESSSATARGAGSTDGSVGSAWRRIGLRQRNGTHLEQQAGLDGEGRSYGGTDRSAPLLNVTRYNEELSRLPVVSFEGTGLDYPMEYRLQQQQRQQQQQQSVPETEALSPGPSSSQATRVPSDEETVYSNTLTSKLAPLGLHDDVENVAGATSSASNGAKASLSFADPPLDTLKAPMEGEDGDKSKKSSKPKKEKKQKKKKSK